MKGEKNELGVTEKKEKRGEQGKEICKRKKWDNK
jgi:hypothetical protein